MSDRKRRVSRLRSAYEAPRAQAEAESGRRATATNVPGGVTTLPEAYRVIRVRWLAEERRVSASTGLPPTCALGCFTISSGPDGAETSFGPSVL